MIPMTVCNITILFGKMSLDWYFKKSSYKVHRYQYVFHMPSCVYFCRDSFRFVFCYYQSLSCTLTAIQYFEKSYFQQKALNPISLIKWFNSLYIFPLSRYLSIYVLMTLLIRLNMLQHAKYRKKFSSQPLH